MKTVIYDFDGTLADSLQPSIEIFNRLAEERGYTKITAENKETFRNKGAREGVLAIGISWLQLPGVVFRLRKDFARLIPTVQLVPGMHEVINQVKKMGYEQAIISSNLKTSVLQFLKNNSIDVFEYVHCSQGLFGKGKLLQDIMKKNNLLAQDTIYIGDEVRDIEAARQAGVKVIAVTWGFNARPVLEQHNPDAIVDRPEEILKFLGI